jgi:orotate phosphoribosyltransferase
VVGAVALCNRGGVTAADLDIPVLHALLELLLDSWAADECPLCRRGVPVNVSVGKGREFLARSGA